MVRSQKRRLAQTIHTALVTAAALNVTPVSAAAGPGPAAADSDLGTVTVTARRREESLQETPVSVSAFTATDLTSRSVVNLADIARAVPNLNFLGTSAGSGGSNQAQIAIRGIGQDDYFFTTEPGVGLYVDGVYVARTAGAVLDLLDVERVEILRGPQGTLFGKNTIGGVVNVITNKPTRDVEGSVELTLGDFSRRDARAVLNAPFSDTVAGRLAVQYRSRDGFGQIINGPELGDRDSLYARALLNWAGDGGWSALFGLEHQRARDGSAPTTLTNANPAHPLAALYNRLVAPASGTPIDNRWRTSDPLDCNCNPISQSDYDVTGASLTIEREFGSTFFKSITGWRDLDTVFLGDTDATPIVGLHQVNDFGVRQWSQELQYGGTALEERLKFVTGLYAFGETGDGTYVVSIMDALFATPARIDAGLDNYNEIDNRSYAVFGQATYRVTDPWSVTLGVRWNDESKEYVLDSVSKLGRVRISNPVPQKADWSTWTPMAGTEYRFAETVFGYLSASRGYKGGGFNGRPTNALALQSFDPEFVWTYEAGLKTSTADNRFRANVAAFYNDYSDIQLTRSVNQGATVIVSTDNIAKARIQGFEIEAAARPVPAWLVQVSLGHLDAEYTRVQPGAPVTLASTLINTPEWTGSLLTTVDVPVGAAGTLSLSADYSYRSEVAYTPDNPLTVEPSVGLLGARATFEAASGRWYASVFGTNLTDEAWAQNRRVSLWFATAQFAAPRMWGATVGYRW